MPKGQILVVDDEPKLVRLVREVLTAMGYSVISAARGEIAVEMVAVEQPDLVVLDIVLADEMDGYETARRIREFSDVPIIMLTAKVRENDLLRGFKAGADDYLTKPFNSKELLARIEAVLKRAQNSESEPYESEIVCGDLHIDVARRRAKVGTKDIHLTRTEFNLLLELARNRNKVLLHDQLLTSVWGSEYRDDVDYLRAYIRLLRKKIESTPDDPKMILTSRGVGYVLSCPEE